MLILRPLLFLGFSLLINQGVSILRLHQSLVAEDADISEPRITVPENSFYFTEEGNLYTNMRYAHLRLDLNLTNIFAQAQDVCYMTAIAKDLMQVASDGQLTGGSLITPTKSFKARVAVIQMIMVDNCRKIQNKTAIINDLFGLHKTQRLEDLQKIQLNTHVVLSPSSNITISQELLS